IIETLKKSFNSSLRVGSFAADNLQTPEKGGARGGEQGRHGGELCTPSISLSFSASLSLSIYCSLSLSSSHSLSLSLSLSFSLSYSSFSLSLSPSTAYYL